MGNFVDSIWNDIVFETGLWNIGNFAHKKW